MVVSDDHIGILKHIPPIFQFHILAVLQSLVHTVFVGLFVEFLQVDDAVTKNGLVFLGSFLKGIQVLIGGVRVETGLVVSDLEAREVGTSLDIGSNRLLTIVVTPRGH